MTLYCHCHWSWAEAYKAQTNMSLQLWIISVQYWVTWTLTMLFTVPCWTSFVDIRACYSRMLYQTKMFKNLFFTFFVFFVKTMSTCPSMSLGNEWQKKSLLSAANGILLDAKNYLQLAILLWFFSKLSLISLTSSFFLFLPVMF